MTDNIFTKEQLRMARFDQVQNMLKVCEKFDLETLLLPVETIKVPKSELTKFLRNRLSPGAA